MVGQYHITCCITVHIVFFGNMVDVYTPNCCISNCWLDPIPLSIPIKPIKPIGRLY